MFLFTLKYLPLDKIPRYFKKIWDLRLKFCNIITTFLVNKYLDFHAAVYF